MAPRRALAANSKTRGYGYEMTLDQEREMERVMEELGLWPNKKAFLREAINKLILEASLAVAARDAGEIELDEDRPAGIREAVRQDRG